MMADSDKSHPWFTTFVLLSHLVSLAASQTGKCTDGTYKHNGLDCCLCGTGLSLKEHCTASLTWGDCQPCPTGRYSSHPTSQMFCEPCTSCSQPSANLEEAEPCTTGSNRKCRCKKDHYCDGATETCTLCQPCKKCGAEGVKTACTANSNTVCKEEGKHSPGKIAGIIVAIVLIIAAVAVGLFFWKKRQAGRTQNTPTEQNNGTATVVEIQPLTVPDVDLQPHLPDIAGTIGWKAMKEVAIRSGIPKTTVESCELDHPKDSQEQTVQLLGIWVEKHGRGASRKLVELLQSMERQDTAEKVVDILSQAAKSSLPA